MAGHIQFVPVYCAAFSGALAVYSVCHLINIAISQIEMNEVNLK